MKTLITTLLLILATGMLSVAQRVGFPPTDYSSYHPASVPVSHPYTGSYTPDPFIVQTLALMNADTIEQTLTDLQNFGSRFMLLDNRKEVAEWLAGKLISYGLTDVRIDSFLCYVNWYPLYFDTLWEYNVVGRLEGASAPDEIYVIGGHYDSYSYEDPTNDAPGADDNGSGTIATMEAARAMVAAGYQPEVTIEFALWAGEELGLYGSREMALQDRIRNRNVRYVYNMDMVANNPEDVDSVVIQKYDNSEWAALVAAEACDLYTTLGPVIPDDWNPQGSDSWAYYEQDFPTIFVQEIAFSPNWHHLSDTIGNCNIPYLTEVARGACATLMVQDKLPYPGDLTAHSRKTAVILSWPATENANVQGFNLYRSEQPDAGFVRINTDPITDTSYSDSTIPPTIPYYYYVRTVGQDLQEGYPSPVAAGAIYAFTDTLLVLNTLKDTETSPDSIRLYYDAVLDTIPYSWVDLNAERGFGLDLLSRHQNILWTANSYEYDPALAPSYAFLSDFFDNGGNMMLSAFNSVKLLGYGITYPYVPGEENILGDFFKADSVLRKAPAMLFQAYPASGDYDTLRIDTAKSLTPGFPGEIYNVEVYAPASSGEVICRFDSHYPSNTQQGIMQDRPVGLEYIGQDFRTIILGFPLWYVDTADAAALMKYVLTEKFTHPTVIPEPGPDSFRRTLTAYPNPASSEVNFVARLSEPVSGRLFLMNTQGIRVHEVFSGPLSAGMQTFRSGVAHLPAGLYQAVLTTSSGTYTCKVIVIP